MEDLDRRSALVLGAAIFAPVIALPRSAAAEMYAPDAGKELAPGVRVVDLSNGEAIIPGFKTVSLIDIVFQPQSNLPSGAMPNAMVCHILEGELKVVQDGKEFQAKKNHVWTCAEGTQEGARNNESTVAIMRITNLLTA